MHKKNGRIVELARAAIIEAVEALWVSNAADGHILSEKGRDIKLGADIMLNTELTDRLSATTGIRCMSEEDIVTHDINKGESFWIVDPLDGSMNFSRDIPLYGVSVALWREGKPIVGIIYDIARKRTIFACDGTSVVDNLPIRVGQVEYLEKAILATGFPVLTDFSEKALVWFTRFAKRFKKIRMLGTAALSLAWVAEGKLDAYFERDIMIWDVAAGLALVEGAGGSYLMLPGRHPHSFDVFAGNQKLLTAMREEVEGIL